MKIISSCSSHKKNSACLNSKTCDGSGHFVFCFNFPLSVVLKHLVSKLSSVCSGTILLCLRTPDISDKTCDLISMLTRVIKASIYWFFFPPHNLIMKCLSWSVNSGKLRTEPAADETERVLVSDFLPYFDVAVLPVSGLSPLLMMLKRLISFSSVQMWDQVGAGFAFRDILWARREEDSQPVKLIKYWGIFQYSKHTWRFSAFKVYRKLFLIKSVIRTPPQPKKWAFLYLPHIFLFALLDLPVQSCYKKRLLDE